MSPSHTCVTAHRAIHESITTPVAELHAKDKALYKAVCDKHGDSIKRDACNLFVKMCPLCVTMKPRAPKAPGHKPIVTHGFASRGQVRAPLSHTTTCSCLRGGVTCVVCVPRRST